MGERSDPSGAATVLILGGTGEGRALAELLAPRPELRVISSLAGRVEQPASLPGEVRRGGFGGAAALARWLVDERVAVVVDATHPFAARISHAAADACDRVGVPLVALRRPGWTAGPGDDWRWADDLAAAAVAVAAVGRRALLTVGRGDLAAFAGVRDVWFLVRSIEPPVGPRPLDHALLLARGPFALADELALLDEHRIDVVVTKDSGGAATRAKLDAARQRQIPVVIVRQPPLPGGDAIAIVDDAVAAAAAVAALAAAGPGTPGAR